MTMNRFLMIAAALRLAAAPLCGQSRSDERAARKEAVAAAKTLRREGFKPMELGDIRTRLEKYFLKVGAGCAQVIGVAENCMSTNLAQVTALSNAATQYALLSGGEVRGRILSSTTSLTGQQVDNIVSSFERLVEKNIRGELVPYVTAVREKRGRITARVYCIVDLDTASRLRRQAMEIALEEQSLASRYGSMVSDWIDEGFAKGGE